MSKYTEYNLQITTHKPENELDKIIGMLQIDYYFDILKAEYEQENNKEEKQ